MCSHVRLLSFRSVSCKTWRGSTAPRLSVWRSFLWAIARSAFIGIGSRHQ